MHALQFGSGDPADESGHRRYRALFESLPIAIFEEDFTRIGEWLDGLRTRGVVDLHAWLSDNPEAVLAAIERIEVLDANAAAVKVLEAPGRGWLLGPLRRETVTEETLASFREQLFAIWENRDRIELELTGLSLAGNRLDGQFRWVAPRLPNGALDLAHVTVAITDITEYRSVQRELETLVDEKDRFLTAVSHELRTPLTGVMGIASVLDESWDVMAGPEKRRLVSDIARESREITDLVEDLLVVSRVRMGRISVEDETVDLTDEVTGVLHSLRRRLVDHAVTFQHTRLAVRGDSLRVRQIIRNLLTNAIRYGGSTIEVASRLIDGRVLVMVSDDGDGVPPDRVEAIFEPYERGDSGPGSPGSVGIGLSVARNLARLMGGDLAYHRHADRTVFELELAAA